MAYIEENLKKRRGANAGDDGPKEEVPYDPHEELFRIEEKYRIKKKVAEEEGNVTNSATMLTAIPEVDLGME
jgi:Hepatocellular carcinoma-associated antigen 59